jgi:hypothetical protein|tara:strand:+ start:911 stop:1195 length:285 start_codon:yes stop_codon:yes gene_type:complete
MVNGHLLNNKQRAGFYPCPQHKEKNKMKQTDTVYLIARPINGIPLNGNEYLHDKDDNRFEFITYDDCVKKCIELGLDDSYVWSIEVEDKDVQEA